MVNGRGPALAALAVAALLLAVPPPGGEARAQQAQAQDNQAAPRADPVAITAGTHDGYARIVFAWPQKVAFETQLDGRSLRVHFARPLAAELTPIERRIDGYVESAALDGPADVIIKLRRDVGLRSFVSEDKKVVVDLLDRLADAAPSAQAASKEAAAKEPAPAPAAPKEAESPPSPKEAPAHAEPVERKGAPAPVPVRVTDNGGARRLVFEWPKTPSYSIDTEKGGAQLHFRNAPTIDAAGLVAEAPELDPEISAHGKDLTVALTLPPGARVNARRDGPHLVVDVVGGKKLTKPTPLPPAAATVPAPTPAAAPSPAHAEAAPAPVVPAAPPEKPRQPPAENAAAEATGPDTGQVPLRYASDDDGATLRFEWPKPVGVAMFRRAGWLWIVFGAKLPVDLAELRANGKAAIREVEQVPHPSATVLRLATVGEFNPSIRRADSAWVVELRPQLLAPEAPIGVGIQPAAEPPRVFFAVRDPGEPVVFRDPEIGDTLVVVPVTQVARGVAREERLVDFTALLTAQGVALRPDSDTVIARSLPNGVEVTSTNGLFLSDEADRTRRRGGSRSGLFDFRQWFGPPDGDVLAQRRALEHNIVAGPPASRSPTRLDLARFYFARGLAQEALGVLGAVQRDDPSAAADPAVRALTGGVMLLSGDLDGAARELQIPALDDEPEIALWRGSLALARHDPTEAANQFARGAAYLRKYPRALRNRFALEAGEAALATGRYDDAGGYVKLVLDGAPSPADRAAAELQAARALALGGEREQAGALYAKLAAGDDRPTRARAMLTKTLDDLDSGKIQRSEAIKTLDGLRFAWRGDEFELALLRRLGELKLKDGDYRGGFEALRQAVANAPDHPDRPAIQRELGQAFADIFVGPSAENVPPLKALALYGEFKELTPPGDQGDEIIRKLADRLVSVDLLDRAGEVLNDQVRNRLKGREQARVGARLALVRLLDRKPELALAALDIPANPGSDAAVEGLTRQRQQLRARALIELGRNDEALKALDGDISRDADRLRADVAWRTKNWGEAGKIFARLAGGASLVPVENATDAEGGEGPGIAKLDDEAARAVLNWGTALTLAGDQAGIAQLGRRYGAAMDAGPYRDAFRVIAGGTTAKGDIRQLAGKVAQINDLQSFMAGYKQKIQSDKLSAIN